MMFGIDDAILYPMIASAGSSILGNVMSSGRQDDAQSFNAYQYAHRYQTQVADMKAAGLNPMLSYTTGAGGGATSSPVAGQGMSDLGAVYNQSKLASAQVANIAADTENKHSQADLIQAQAEATRASAGASVASAALAEKQAAEIAYKLDRNYWEDDQYRIRMMAKELRSQYDLNIERGKSEVESRAVMAATVKKLEAEGKLAGFDVKAAENFGNLGRNSGQLKVVLDILLPLLKGK